MSKRRKIKSEDKIRTARACANGTISLNAAAEQLGVHPSVVDDWVRQYESEGIEAFLPGGGNQRYEPAIKEAAVKDYLSGRGSLRDICRIYKIRNQIQLRSWIAEEGSTAPNRTGAGANRN